MGFVLSALSLLLAPAAGRFGRSLDRPAAAQARLQRRLVAQVAASDYGRAHGVRQVADWERLPVVTYDDLRPWLAQQRAEGRSLLTREPVLFYERTSGSSGPAKEIPYTRSLRRAFNHLFCVWAFDLLRHGPRFSSGKFYFCISPKLQEADPDPQGLQDDSEYLDPWLRWLLRPFWVLPEAAHRPQSVAQFKRQLAIALLAEERLEILSLWSPSFLSAQLDYIQAHQHELRRALAGTLSPERDRLLAAPEISWNRLWPHLRLISCWDSATAADSAEGLRRLFPGALVQGKGLLATEAPMTVPLIAAQGCVPLVDTVLFEFEDEAGKIWQIQEIQPGIVYELIISQSGGLYRYRMGDRVRVTHVYRSTPCLEFLGRSRDTSDLVGEKLTVAFVAQVLADLDLAPARFACLAPVLTPRPHYALLLDLAPDSEAIAQRLETALGRSPQYRHARLLGQLGPVAVAAAADMAERLSVARAQSSTRWGDVKHSALLTQPFGNLEGLLLGTNLSQNPDETVQTSVQTSGKDPS